jgi:hypothetical protein
MTDKTLQQKQAEYYEDMLNSFHTSLRGDQTLHVVMESDTNPMLNLPFLTDRTSFTLASAVTTNDTTFTATAGHGITVGRWIELAEGSCFTQGIVLDVSVNDITIDRPATNDFTTSAVCQHSSDDISAASGTLASPVIFSIEPLNVPPQAGDITRMMFTFRDDAAMDFTTFASAPVLTNGMVVRVNHGDGTYTNIFNIKDNGDIIEQAFDHDFFVNVGNTIRGFASRNTWDGQDKRGVAIRLDGTLGEKIEVLVQDNVAALLISKIALIAQGHVTS